MPYKERVSNITDTFFNALKASRRHIKIFDDKFIYVILKGHKKCLMTWKKVMFDKKPLIKRKGQP